ncbi:MAG: hypothetical protein ACF8PG_11315 [Maioricimonas sp. JB045]
MFRGIDRVPVLLLAVVVAGCAETASEDAVPEPDTTASPAGDVQMDDERPEPGMTGADSDDAASASGPQPAGSTTGGSLETAKETPVVEEPAESLPDRSE